MGNYDLVPTQTATCHTLGQRKEPARYFCLWTSDKAGNRSTSAAYHYYYNVFIEANTKFCPSSKKEHKDIIPWGDKCIFFCVWQLLLIVIVNFICITSSINWHCLFIAIQYLIICIFHYSLMHSIFHRYLYFLQFWGYCR